MNKTMKAAAIHQFGGIDRFEIIDVAIPEIEDDEILIRPTPAHRSDHGPSSSSVQGGCAEG